MERLKIPLYVYHSLVRRRTESHRESLKITIVETIQHEIKCKLQDERPVLKQSRVCVELHFRPTFYAVSGS